MPHIREAKHGAASTKQAVAIGLSKARRAGVRLGVPKRGSHKVRKQAPRDLARGLAVPGPRGSAPRHPGVRCENSLVMSKDPIDALFPGRCLLAEGWMHQQERDVIDYQQPSG